MVKYSDSALTLVFAALSHPIRRGMIEHSLRSKVNLSALAKRFGVSLPAITKHLKVLQNARLIQLTQEGREKEIQVNVNELNEAALWVEQQRLFWQSSLSQLEQYLEQEGTQ